MHSPPVSSPFMRLGDIDGARTYTERTQVRRRLTAKYHHHLWRPAHHARPQLPSQLTAIRTSTTSPQLTDGPKIELNEHTDMQFTSAPLKNDTSTPNGRLIQQRLSYNA